MYKILTSVITLLILIACSVSAEQPNTVAQQFWESIGNGDINSAQKLAVDGDNISSLTETKIKQLTFGKSTLNENNALVPTEFIGNNEGRFQSYSFSTVLKKNSGQWKVDIADTVASLIESQNK